MTRPLRTLIVDDSEEDALLMARELRSGGYDPSIHRVQTPTAMAAALEGQTWDVVLGDYSMPQFGGLAALELLKKKGLDIPFISVSGTMGEETAVLMMKAGAADYVMKDNLARLIPAIERELRETNQRREQSQAADTLARLKMRFHAVWDNSVDGMRLTNEAGEIVAVNEAFCHLVGLRADELVGKPLTMIYAATENLEQLLFRYRQRFRARTVEKRMERTLTFRNGKTVDLEVSNSFIELPGQAPLLLGLFRDTTEHKQAQRALRKSEAQFRLLWESSLDGMRLLDEEGTILMVNEAYCRLVERSKSALEGNPLAIVYEAHRQEEIMRKHRERFVARTIPPHFEKEVTLWSGKKVFVELSNSFLDIEGQPSRLLSTFRDISETKRAQKRIQHLEQERALATLSHREAEVLRYLAQGCLYKEIADKLSISIDTVRKHLGSIYNKLHVHSRTDAVVKYLQK